MMTTPELFADMATGTPVIRLVEGTVPVIGVTFPDDSPLGGLEMVPALQELVELVDGILEAFAAIPR
jgi:hypothetical protein